MNQAKCPKCEARMKDASFAGCVNRNAVSKRAIQSYCEEKGIAVAGRIPYDPAVTGAMMNVLSVAEYPCGQVTEEVKKIWKRLEEYLSRVDKTKCSL